MAGSNLGHWLFGMNVRTAEFAATQDLWDQVERAWLASPASTADTEVLATNIIGQVLDRLNGVPATPLLIALGTVAEALLWDEDFQPIEPSWELIETDVCVAVEFRQLLERRSRWAEDFEALLGIMRDRLANVFVDFICELPPSSFDTWPTEGGAFTAPLIDLLDEPALVIERLLFTPYIDEAFHYDLFRNLRIQFTTNLVVASGYPANTNPHEVKDRLVMPTAQRRKTPRELVDLYLAHTPFAALMDLPVPLALGDEIRFEHMHIIGGTGHGKTQLMQQMIHADLTTAQTERRSVVVIDSQGDLIAKLQRLALFSPNAPSSLADKLVLIDPADVEFPAALNLFDAHLSRIAGYRPVDRERVLNGVVELYETFFGAMLGAELTQKQGVIFRYLARLMVAIPGATIHTLMQLMDDGRPFKPYMDALEGTARHFFATEFFHPSFAATKKQISKRLWGVLSTPAFERMFAQEHNKLDLFEALQDGKIILVSTAKDLLKTDGSALFGRFVIALLAQAALERSTVSPDERTPTFVYVDEAQEYFDDNVETILNQARKYRVGLTLAHQTLDQLSPRLRAAILASTSVKCVGGVSSRDARALADELHTDVAFIESMRRRADHTEFAVWLKNQTPRAVRMSVPLGFLERQPKLSAEEHEALLDRNRGRYCSALETARPFNTQNVFGELTTGVTTFPVNPSALTPDIASLPMAHVRPAPSGEPGKGGKEHKYLQSLVKELAEQQGFKAVIEAPIPDAAGQIDVLLTRGDLSVAVEVSVTTPADWERENLRKCFAAGYTSVALVLAKTKGSQARYRRAVVEGLDAEDCQGLVLLSPEELPAYIASLAPPPEPSEQIVRGYRVKVTQAQLAPADAKVRRETLAKLVARSLNQPD